MVPSARLTAVTTSRFASGLVVAALAVLAVGCATTIKDETEPTITVATGLQPADESATQLDSEVIVDRASATTVPIAGSAANLLPDLAVEMSRLSGTIVGGGDVATLAIIEGTWAAVRDEIASTRPELINSMQVMIDMANTAVDRNRPADADKAFSLMSDLIDAYLGDG